MNDLPRKALRELIQRYGTSLCDDTPRFRGLLRDFCGAHRREINLLVNALEAKVAHDLLRSSVATPKPLLLSRLMTRLQDEFGVEEWLARWAVESWALALGTIAQGEQLSPEMPPISKPSPREGGPKPPSPKPLAKPTPPRSSGAAGGTSSGSSGGTVRPPRSRPIPRTVSAPTPPVSAGASPLPPPMTHAPLARPAGGAPVAAPAQINKSNAGSCFAVGVGVFFLFIAAMMAAGDVGAGCIVPLLIGIIVIYWGRRKH